MARKRPQIAVLNLSTLIDDQEIAPIVSAAQKAADHDFEPASRAQAFCSKRCASGYQYAVNPRPRTPQRGSGRRHRDAPAGYNDVYSRRRSVEATATPARRVTVGCC